MPVLDKKNPPTGAGLGRKLLDVVRLKQKRKDLPDKLSGSDECYENVIYLDPPKGAFWRFFNIQKPPINTPWRVLVDL